MAGLCIRMYPQSLYEEDMPASRCPSVVEDNLSHLVLLLKRLDIADMGQCKFLDRPGERETRAWRRLSLVQVWHGPRPN